MWIRTNVELSDILDQILEDYSLHAVLFEIAKNMNHICPQEFADQACKLSITLDEEE